MEWGAGRGHWGLRGCDVVGKGALSRLWVRSIGYEPFGVCLQLLVNAPNLAAFPNQAFSWEYLKMSFPKACKGVGLRSLVLSSDGA